MSIAGIASNSNLFQNSVVQQTQNRFQQIQSQFQKLGQDLQSGNLTQAKSDFSTLSQELPNGGQFGASSATSAAGATSSTSSSPILQAFQSLGKDLQSGNLSAAQQDFAAIQQSAQQSQASGQAHHGHHHHHSGGDSSSTRARPSPRSSKTSHRSARISSPAIFRPRSRLTPRCNPTCSNSCRASLRPAPRRTPRRHPQPPASASPRNRIRNSKVKRGRCAGGVLFFFRATKSRNESHDSQICNRPRDRRPTWPRTTQNSNKSRHFHILLPEKVAPNLPLKPLRSSDGAPL